MSNILERVMHYLGKKRNDVSNPCITVNECIELANSISAIKFDLKVANNRIEILNNLIGSLKVGGESIVREFAESILHGDEDHRKWLIDAAIKFEEDILHKVNSPVIDDTKRLDWLSSTGSHIGWNRDGDACRVFIDIDDDTGSNPASGWETWFPCHRAAIDSAMKPKGDL